MPIRKPALPYINEKKRETAMANNQLLDEQRVKYECGCLAFEITKSA